MKYYLKAKCAMFIYGSNILIHFCRLHKKKCLRIIYKNSFRRPKLICFRFDESKRESAMSVVSSIACLRKSMLYSAYVQRTYTYFSTIIT